MANLNVYPYSNLSTSILDVF